MRRWCAGGISPSSTARSENQMKETQLVRCASATGQKRLVDHLGCSTAVAPAQSVASSE